MSKSKVMVSAGSFRTPRRKPQEEERLRIFYRHPEDGEYRCADCGVKHGEPHRPDCRPAELGEDL